MTAYPSPSPSAPYAAPAEAFAERMATLRAPPALSSDHAVVERLVRDEGREAYWQLHKRREFWRNHASRYADAEGAWLWQEAA
ncbi:MAG: hypothetical protein EXR69_02165 [Myxococcales bacterium]|nr:hypothetical protein [Myxococcales bacterium]